MERGGMVFDGRCRMWVGAGGLMDRRFEIRLEEWLAGGCGRDAGLRRRLGSGCIKLVGVRVGGAGCYFVADADDGVAGAACGLDGRGGVRWGGLSYEIEVRRKWAAWGGALGVDWVAMRLEAGSWVLCAVSCGELRPVGALKAVT